MDNKLFVVGGFMNPTCEIFEGYSRMFCYITRCLDLYGELYYFQAVCTRSQIVAFGEVYGGYETKMFNLQR